MTQSAQSRVLLLLAHFVLWDMEILFPQHVAAANKSSMTGVSLDLSPLFVPSISDLYVRLREFVQNLSPKKNVATTRINTSFKTNYSGPQFNFDKKKSTLGGVDLRVDRCVCVLDTHRLSGGCTCAGYHLGRSHLCSGTRNCPWCLHKCAGTHRC